MRFLDEKRKNVLRAYVAQAASVLEIIIAVLVLAAILITGVRVTGEIFGPVSYTHLTLPTNREV